MVPLITQQEADRMFVEDPSLCIVNFGDVRLVGHMRPLNDDKVEFSVVAQIKTEPKSNGGKNVC